MRERKKLNKSGSKNSLLLRNNRSTADFSTAIMEDKDRGMVFTVY